MNVRWRVIVLSFLMAGGCWAAEILKPAITNAADATERAVQLANQAIADRTSRQFTRQSGTAVLNGQYWIWRGRMGYGKGDLSVTVTLRSDGQVVNTQIAEWISIPQQEF